MMKKPFSIKNQTGFTLIEMVLVILAIGIIGTMAAAMLGQGADIYKETVYRQSFLSQARSTFWRMSREGGLQRNSDNFNLSGPINFYAINAIRIFENKTRMRFGVTVKRIGCGFRCRGNWRRISTGNYIYNTLRSW